MHINQRDRQYIPDEFSNRCRFIFRFAGLIADGIHSLSDLSSDFVVLIANKKARKPLIPIIIMVTCLKTVQS
jgi:hypothetical protein